MRQQNNNKENRIRYIKIRATEKEREALKSHCKKYNYNLSQRLRVIIEKELKGEIK